MNRRQKKKKLYKWAKRHPEKFSESPLSIGLLPSSIVISGSEREMAMQDENRFLKLIDDRIASMHLNYIEVFSRHKP